MSQLTETYMRHKTSTLWGREKWPTFCWRHFQMHFRGGKVLNCIWHFLDICSLASNWQDFTIGSDNGLASNTWQAIIWSNDDQVDRRIYESPVTWVDLLKWACFLGTSIQILAVTYCTSASMKSSAPRRGGVIKKCNFLSHYTEQ